MHASLQIPVVEKPETIDIYLVNSSYLPNVLSNKSCMTLQHVIEYMQIELQYIFTTYYTIMLVEYECVQNIHIHTSYCLNKNGSIFFK